MIEIQDKFLNPLAVLIGSLLISLSILVSAGVITIPGVKINKGTSAQAPDVNSNNAQAPAGPKSVDQMVANLKKYASQLGLKADQFNQCLDSSKMASLVQTDQDSGVKVGVNGTPATFINGYMISGAQPNKVFKDTLDLLLAGGNFDNLSEDKKYLADGNAGNGEVGVLGQTGQADRTKLVVEVGNLPVLGDPNAPITVVEYSDYQCPFCERFYSDAENVIKDYVKSGKVKFYYRDFPLTSIHPGAQKGAEAARCAGEQNKYWEFHDLVFKNQSNIF